MTLLSKVTNDDIHRNLEIRFHAGHIYVRLSLHVIKYHVLTYA
jgi:hypothetical protein